MSKRAGDKLEISATKWNAIDDVLRRSKGSIHDRLDGLASAFGGASTIKVINRTGAIQQRYRILGLGESFHSPSSSLDQFKNKYVLEADLPELPDHRQLWGITTGSIAPDGVGELAIGGCVVCQIDITSTHHKFANIADSEVGNLVSGFWGNAQIVWRESGTGLKWAVVRLGSYWSHLVKGKVGASAIAKGGTATITVWSGIGSSAASTSATVENVYSRMALSAASGKFVYLAWVDDNVELVGLEC